MNFEKMKDRASMSKAEKDIRALFNNGFLNNFLTYDVLKDSSATVGLYPYDKYSYIIAVNKTPWRLQNGTPLWSYDRKAKNKFAVHAVSINPKDLHVSERVKLASKQES